MGTMGQNERRCGRSPATPLQSNWSQYVQPPRCTLSASPPLCVASETMPPCLAVSSRRTLCTIWGARGWVPVGQVTKATVLAKLPPECPEKCIQPHRHAPGKKKSTLHDPRDRGSCRCRPTDSARSQVLHSCLSIGQKSVASATFHSRRSGPLKVCANCCDIIVATFQKTTISGRRYVHMTLYSIPVFGGGWFLLHP